MTRLSRIITAAALILATPCARAFALRRSGLMRFRYDNIAVRNPSERRTDSSLFHGYNLDLGGLLLNRAVGSFDSGVEYSDGANVDASVSVDSPRQRIFAYNASAQLFHPSVRRYFVFDPNFSVRSTKFSGSGGAPGHTVSDDGWGFTSGLTLWKLPSLSVSRQFNTVRDLNGPIPTDQKLHLRTDTISHRIGRVRLKFSEDERRTDDRLSLSPAPLLGTRRGSLDYSRNEIKPLGLQSFSINSNYNRLSNDGVATQKSVSNRIGLRGRDIQTKHWKHVLSYSNDAQRDLLFRQTAVYHDFRMASNRPLRNGTFSNSVNGNVTRSSFGSSRSLGAAPGVQLRFADGRVGTSANADGRITRGPTGVATFSDSFGSRLTLKPRPPLEVFADFQTSGSQAISGGGGDRQRTRRCEFGGNRQSGVGESSFRYTRTERRGSSASGRSVNDQFNVSASATPIARLRTDGGFNFSTTKTETGAVYASRNIRGGANYRFLWGLHLNAHLSVADGRQYKSGFGAFYALGKTTLSLTFLHSSLQSSSSVSHLSFSLTRAL
ncbi:MAG: hypothetical protein AUJ52_11565 [Elusimicrobia bacterium CG1_02_63_36]|nr:MAG: hypothetical protein AUJ52_11565 [Elusimicrobia bacterium CG1_02_63_36]